ncbi:hypothetical protein MUK42_35626 [Musa troglodytarum]|uniref:CRC domain-containing protein n=1 Tax=Musa troglodytarum TaxID=320322 RepID=A0A9E7JBS7_9LILI|nr:hypothetical protein MUK42_35626 [Musa troglodytarum]
MYCSDACGCQHCPNRPEYQEMISDLTEEIETQNTHAFGPNVVQPADQPSVLGLHPGTEWDAIAGSPIACRITANVSRSGVTLLENSSFLPLVLLLDVVRYICCPPLPFLLLKAKMGCSRLCHCEGCNNPFDRNGTESFMESKKREEDSYGGKPCNEDSLQVLTANSCQHLFLPSHHSGISLPCASSDPVGSRRVAEPAHPSPALGSFGQLASADALPAGSFPHSQLMFPRQNIVPPWGQSPINYTTSDVTEHSAQ